MKSYFSKLREDSGYTIQDLSALTNIPVSYLLELEKGKKKGLANGGRVCYLASYLGIDVDELSDVITGDID